MLQRQLLVLVLLLSAYRIGAESVLLDLEDSVVPEIGIESVDGTWDDSVVPGSVAAGDVDGEEALYEAQVEALTIMEVLSLAEDDDEVLGSLDRRLERLRRAETGDFAESAPPVDLNEDTKAELQSILDQMTTSTKSARVKRDGMALLVSNDRGETLFDVRTKSFTPWTKRNLASGSKLIAGITLLKCINDTPSLSLQSTTGEILGWTKNGDLTIDVLGAFASGSLPGSSDPINAFKEAWKPNPSVSTKYARCLMNRSKTTTQCVNEHLKNADFKGPGTSRYEPLGPSHAIVAAMCEKASGRSFMSWFNELKNTLGVEDKDFTYSCFACFDVNAKFPYGNAWQFRKNPSISAGLSGNAVELRKFLTLLVNKGMHNGEQLIAEDLILRMGRNEYNGRYGWFSFACPNSKKGEQCAVFGHGGSWGMKMWADLDSGYSAVLMMMSDPKEKLDDTRQFTNMNGPVKQIKNLLDEVLAPAPTPSPTKGTESPTQSPTEPPTASPTPSPPPALERNMKTKGGCTCLNSWSYKGKKYNGCRVTPGHDQPWCRFNVKSCNMWKFSKTNWQGWDWCKSEMVAASKK